ncbi:MAG: DUF6404 family protein, partial [Stenotrophomonas sp.]
AVRGPERQEFSSCLSRSNNVLEREAMTSVEGSAEPFGDKVRRLQNDLVARGEHLSFAAPPACRLAWRLGWNCTPPLFRGFWANTLTLGGVWGILWLIGWTSLPYIPGHLDATSFVFAALGAACFGFVIAGMAHHQRKRLRLPAWRDY